jgi:hypothetical protein
VKLLVIVKVARECTLLHVRIGSARVKLRGLLYIVRLLVCIRMIAIALVIKRFMCVQPEVMNEAQLFVVASVQDCKRACVAAITYAVHVKR